VRCRHVASPFLLPDDPGLRLARKARGTLTFEHSSMRHISLSDWIVRCSTSMLPAEIV